MVKGSGGRKRGGVMLCVEADRNSVSVSVSAPKVAKMLFRHTFGFGRNLKTKFRFFFGFGRNLFIDSVSCRNLITGDLRFFQQRIIGGSLTNITGMTRSTRANYVKHKPDACKRAIIVHP